MSRQTVRSTAAPSQISIEQVGSNVGAEVHGVDLSQPLADAEFQAIHDALAKHGLLIFPDQDITVEQQMAFGRRFGELSVHPFGPNLDDAPELIILDNHKDNPPFGTNVWHSDETFRVEPPMATVLRAKQVPKVGGDTLWASMTAAYKGLSDRMKHHISSLEAVHDFVPFRRLFSDDPKSRAKLHELEDAYPNVCHPVVREHPVTGERVLFVNPQFTIRIKDMAEQESRTLLDFLFRQAEIPDYQFRLRWRPNTVAMWDNRSTQHYATHDYYPQRRTMERVTIKGDRPYAPKADAPARTRGSRTRAADRGGRDGSPIKRPTRQFEREMS